MRTTKNVIVMCLDGKERLIKFCSNDLRNWIEYANMKNGKEFGSTYVLLSETKTKLPKWITQEMLKK